MPVFFGLYLSLPLTFFIFFLVVVWVELGDNAKNTLELNAQNNILVQTMEQLENRVDKIDKTQTKKLDQILAKLNTL
jgi:hypothetical protein